MSGGKHGAHVIRQSQKRAHRNVQLATRRRRRIVRCGDRSRGRTKNRPLPAVRKLDDDQRRPSPRISCADRITFAIKWMMRINHPDLSDSAVKRCGIPTCSGIRSSPPPCSTGCCTMPSSCRSKALATGYVSAPTCSCSRVTSANQLPKRRHAVAAGHPRQRRPAPAPHEPRSSYNSVTSRRSPHAERSPTARRTRPERRRTPSSLSRPPTRQAGANLGRYRRTLDRRSRAQRWRDAVADILALQAEYAAWSDNLPDGLRDTATAEALQAIVDLDLDDLTAIVPPCGYGRDRSITK
jgi:hypothetical protein